MYKTPFPSPNGVVATEEFVSSVMGYKALESGGNAIDASIITSLTLALTIPHLGGIGGDFFALIYIANEDKVYYINGSGFAPHKLDINTLRSIGYTRMPNSGPFSITVPGLLDALYEIWRRFGTLEWSDLINKVYALAKNGFPASYSLTNAYRQYRHNLIKDTGSKMVYSQLDNTSYGIRRLVNLRNAA